MLLPEQAGVLNRPSVPITTSVNPLAAAIRTIVVMTTLL